MATLRSYSATFEQNDLANAALTRWRFNEGAGTTATDSVDALDGIYEPGAAPGAAGSIGDGAASFDGNTGFVLVETLSGSVSIATLGDSLSAGDNDFQDPGDTFADDLPTALEARGLTVTYFDHSISGSTTADGFARVDDVIADSPDVVILELGTNDAGGKVPLGTVQGNLNDIIDALQGEGINDILLTSTFGAFPEKGTGYTDPQDRDDFEALFPQIAQTQGVELLNDPDGSDKFLGGERIANNGAISADEIVGGVLDSADPSLSAGDGLHPNADGIDYIVQRVAPQTIELGAAAGVISDPLVLDSGSFEMWLTADDTSTRQTLISKNAADGDPGRMSAQLREGGELRMFLSTDGGTTVDVRSDPGAVQDGVPTHVVFNFGAGGMELYVNGELVDTDPSTQGISVYEPLVIGAESGASTPGGVLDNPERFFSGVIDEVGVYDRALSGDEVLQLFDGGSFGTTVLGTAQADTIVGGSDNEELRGAGGNDIIAGNGGDDELRGGGGDDLVQGGPGNDDLFGGRGGDELRGGAGNDSLDGKDGADILAGGEGDDVLEGSAGGDLLSGAGGTDQLFGNQGADDLRGGTGDDLLNGGNDRDTLTGGPGADTFQIDKISQGVDHVQDFTPGAGGDILDLSAVLDFQGGDVNDFVQLNEVNGNTKVDVNPDGAGTDFTTVFNLHNTTGLDLGTLVADGNVQVNAPAS